MRNLGSSGLRVSEVGLGCNNFGARVADVEITRRVVDKAIDLGITLFDTADVYGNKGGSETQLGQILGNRRKLIVLATKFGMQMNSPEEKGASRSYIMNAVEASLRRLRTDWIDLYQLHQADPLTPIEETLRALDDLIRQGKIRYVGISNYPAWQACEALWAADRRGYQPPVVTQNRYNVLDRGLESELLPFCRAHGVGIIPYSPLAGGMLTGKYRSGEPVPSGVRGHNNPGFQQQLTERNLTLVGRLESFARDQGHTVGELAIAWLLSRPEVSSVIAGATRPEQVEANAAAASWKLSADDLKAIDELMAG